jgi:NAD(P)-dependent dehydrogenase (short-subunit alcohol dehydrogenase family)
LKNESLVILVTGGTRGIGAAIAAQLHERGHRVYVTQRAQVESGQQDGVQVLALDVTSAASVEACVHGLLRREGRIDVLVNNAGYDLYGAVLETPWHDFMDQLDTNFLGAARMVQAVLPRMLEQRSGRIINISSIGGEVGLPMNAAYSASKFALEGYTESLRQELLPLGLHACTVSPSPVASGPHDQSIWEVSGADNPFAQRRAELVQRMRRDALSSRTRPEHVAAAVVQAVHARAPAPRYRVGALARWIPRLKGWLPDTLFEQFMRRVFP